MRRGAANALTLLGLTGILFAYAGSAAAQFAPPPVQAQPSPVNVPATRSATVQTTWVITNPSPDPILSVNSPGAQGTFTGPNGSGSLSFPQPLAFGQINSNGTGRIPETLVIPQSFLMRALQAGTRTISIEREFNVEIFTGQFIPVTGIMEVNITGSLGAGFQISRIDLRFQNEAVQIIVPQHHPPEVRLDVAYTGTGLLQGAWEIADPRVTATGGNPIFRILRQDRVRLGIGGFARVKGPPLPADLTGLYIVRFRILDGALRGEAPVVRYFVKAASPDGEDWWKHYIRPHNEGQGMVRVPDEPENGEVTVEESTGEDEGQPEEDEKGTPDDGGTPDDSGDSGN